MAVELAVDQQLSVRRELGEIGLCAPADEDVAVRPHLDAAERPGEELGGMLERVLERWLRCLRSSRLSISADRPVTADVGVVEDVICDPPCARTWCCQEKSAVSATSKSDFLPLRRHMTSPVLRWTL